MKSAHVLLLFVCSATSAFQNCPLLGPVFPRPTRLSSSLAFQNATVALQDAIDAAIAAGTIQTSNSSFSIEMFSAHEADPLFEFHKTSPGLADSPGTKVVDSNSIYRIGSISKLFTVYLFLIEAGDVHFNEPVTKYIPELAAVADKAEQDPISYVDWNHVTIGDLASQLAGVGRDCE